MNSAPWAKLTTPSMPNTIVSPSAVITRTAPRAIPERSCMMINDRSIAQASGRVAQLAATAQHVVGTRVVGENGEQIVVVGHGCLEGGVESSSGLALRLQAPIIVGAADHALEHVGADREPLVVQDHRHDDL